MITRTTLLAVFGVLYSSTSGFSADCNPVDFKRSIVYSQDIRTNILYARELVKTKKFDGSHDAGADYLGLLSATDSGRASYLDNLQDRLKLQISETDKRFLFVTDLDPEGKEGYARCLEAQSKSLYIIPPLDETVLSSQFAIRVHLRKFPTDSLIPIKIGITNGSFVNYPGVLKPNRNGTELAARIKNDSDLAITIKRDLAKSFSLIASAGSSGSESDEMTLPAQLTVVREELRFSDDKFESACDRCNSTGQSKSLCISVPDNEVIIPGTANYMAYQAGGGTVLVPGPGRVQLSYDPHQACITAGTSTTSNQGEWCGVGYLTVRVLVTMPRSQASSGRPQQAPYALQCVPPH